MLVRLSHPTAPQSLRESRHAAHLVRRDCRRDFTRPCHKRRKRRRRKKSTSIRSTSRCRTSRPTSRSSTTTTSSTSAPAGRRQGPQALLHRLLVARDAGARRRPDAAAPRRQRGAARRGRRRLGHRSGRLLRRRVGLLRPHPRPARTTASGTRRGRGPTSTRSTCKTRKIVRLTNQKFTPEHRRGRLVEGLSARRSRARSYFEYGVFNMGAVPAAGRPGRLHQQPQRLPAGQGLPRRRPAAVRHGRRTPTSATTTTPPNLEKIGHLNIAGALHPVVLTDGRIMFSSLESQGLRGDILWGIWTIHPDGTELGPAGQRLRPGRRAQRLPLPDAALRRLDRRRGVLQPEQQRLRRVRQAAADRRRTATPPFGPAYMNDPRNPPWRYGRHDNGTPQAGTACRSCRPARCR